MSTNSTNSGSYLLIINLKAICRIVIGALGETTFEPGWYVYVGSARKNLRSRIARHLSDEKKLRWHIDYFLQEAQVGKVLISVSKSEIELGEGLMHSENFKVISRFGSSDSPLPGHLFFCNSAKTPADVVSLLPNAIRTAMDDIPPKLT